MNVFRSVYLDAGDEPNAVLCCSSGSGRTFDWSLAGTVERPFFLAGGLGSGNLAEAIRRVKPWAVDLSSALETDGYKDPQKMREAVQIVRTTAGEPG